MLSEKERVRLNDAHNGIGEALKYFKEQGIGDTPNTPTYEVIQGLHRASCEIWSTLCLPEKTAIRNDGVVNDLLNVSACLTRQAANIYEDRDKLVYLYGDAPITKSMDYVAESLKNQAAIIKAVRLLLMKEPK